MSQCKPAPIARCWNLQSVIASRRPGNSISRCIGTDWKSVLQHARIETGRGIGPIIALASCGITTPYRDNWTYPRRLPQHSDRLFHKTAVCSLDRPFVPVGGNEAQLAKLRVRRVWFWPIMWTAEVHRRHDSVPFAQSTIIRYDTPSRQDSFLEPDSATSVSCTRMLESRL